MNKVDLEEWLSTNTAACNVEIDIDSMLVPADNIAKQFNFYYFFIIFLECLIWQPRIVQLVILFIH